MSLTLDATVGGSASNAYADVVAATAAAAYRVGGTAASWLSLSSDQQIQTLVTATRDLDTVPYRGTRATATQALEWPRVCAGFSSSTIPSRLTMATIELAWSYAPALASGATVTDVLAPDTSDMRIKQDTVGPITTVYFTPPTQPVDWIGRPIPNVERFPAIVQRLLAPLILVAVPSVWGTSTVVRSS